MSKKTTFFRVPMFFDENESEKDIEEEEEKNEINKILGIDSDENEEKQSKPEKIYIYWTFLDFSEISHWYHWSKDEIFNETGEDVIVVHKKDDSIVWLAMNKEQMLKILKKAKINVDFCEDIFDSVD